MDMHKDLIDAASLALVIGTLAEWLPPIAAAISIVWTCIRQQDTGTAVPADIQQYRNEVRLAAGTIEGQIAACADLDAFKALFEVPVDANGVPTGNAPVYNWPDPI